MGEEPSICQACIVDMNKRPAGGAEIDTVNAAARLASEARAGEVLVSEDALADAGGDGSALERRELALRGRASPLTVRVAGHETIAELAVAGT